MKDFLGNEIVEGEYILYSTASGNVVYTKIGKVIKVNEEKYSLLVQGYEKNWDGEFKVLCKKSTIFNVDRVIMIGTASVPKEILITP